MGQEIQVPDWAKNAPAQAFAALNAQDDNLAEGIGQSYAVIGYKGKVWSIRVRGERHNFIRPDDGTPSSYLDVIILGQAKQKSKSFYKKFDPNTSDGDRPICSSIDGVVPDADVTQKQCDNCALCPKNVWKTDPATGRKGRECTDYKRLAVLVLPTQTKAILGEPLMEAAFLRVPPASLNSLAIMGDTMTGQGFHYSTYITRISFDPNEAHPKMQFRPLQGLTDKEAPVIIGLRTDQTVGRIIGGEFSGAMRTVGGTEKIEVLPPGSGATGIVIENPPQPSQPSTAGQSTPGTGPGTPSAQNGAQVQAAQTQANGSGASASVQPATIVAAASPPASSGQTPAQSAPTVAPPASGLVDTGFGGATGATTQQASPQPAQQSTGDTGAAEATDGDLDQRIANLIKPAA